MDIIEIAKKYLPKGIHFWHIEEDNDKITIEKTNGKKEIIQKSQKSS